ncbi:MAG: MarR family transcriptional regulator [Bacteroidales bacterium]|nr:MarR family transcriptional regulator [Bacteroidales bacterium]
MKIEDEIKGRFRNEYHKGLINLTYTVKQVSYDFHQALKKHGLTEQQYNVLKVLRGFRTEGPCSIGFLKDRMLDKKSDVSRIVDKLFAKKLIVRKENLTDRRQKDLEITNKGLSLLTQMDNCEKIVDTLLSNLSLDEVKQLNRLLDKIRGN